ncbi:MAG: hypothetical protein U1E81_18510 [Xanthobacteraceae bacterium]
MATHESNPLQFPHQGRRRDVLDFLAAIVCGILIWAIFVAAGLAIFVAIAGAETIVARDAMGREIYTTTRRNGGVVTRDRLGREVLQSGRH